MSIKNHHCISEYWIFHNEPGACHCFSPFCHVTSGSVFQRLKIGQPFSLVPRSFFVPWVWHLSVFNDIFYFNFKSWNPTFSILFSRKLRCGFSSDFLSMILWLCFWLFRSKETWQKCQITITGSIVDYSKKFNSLLHVSINVELECPHNHVVWWRCYVCFDIHAIILHVYLIYEKKLARCRNKIGIPVKLHGTIYAGMQISHVDMRCVCRSASNIWKHVTN